jgi:hypothetical protein
MSSVVKRFLLEKSDRHITNVTIDHALRRRSRCENYRKLSAQELEAAPARPAATPPRQAPR